MVTSIAKRRGGSRQQNGGAVARSRSAVSFYSCTAFRAPRADRLYPGIISLQGKEKSPI